MLFDGEKTFEENLAAFRKHAEGIDAELAEILFEQLSILAGSGDRRSNVAAFNQAVSAALERLGQSDDPQ